ncbi:MAG: restriction endonuclease [Acidimicrobiales bacterium]
MADDGGTLPRYSDLMLPVLRAVASLGGSATNREITEAVVDAEQFDDEQMAIKYPTRDRSILWDRLEWARSYCRLSGVLESPKRGLFVVSPLGSEVLSLPDAEARARLAELDRQVRAARPRKGKAAVAEDDAGDLPPEAEAAAVPDQEDTGWQDRFLARLHALSPTRFENFALLLLRAYGLELTHVGGTGDEGIDGIGTVPLSEVLSATVAVQAKRYAPDGKSIGRDTVALFQRDAAAVGAERAVLVTLATFTSAARKAATTVTPRVDLIDGRRICELALARSIGVSMLPVVDDAWFDRYETAG